MEADAVLADEGDEVFGRVAGESGFGEVGIGGEEVFGADVEIGEVAAASAGDEDLAAGLAGVFDEGDAMAVAGDLGGAEETGGAGSENDGVVGQTLMIR